MKVLRVDTNELLRRFEQLSTKNMAAVHKTALTRGATIVRRDVRKEIRKTFKNKEQRYKDMYKGGVQITKRRSGNLVKVHLFGIKDYYYSYILRFFAGGTDYRYTKAKWTREKASFRGYVDRTDFFKNVDLENVYKEINNSLGKNILKRFNNGK